MKHLLLLFVAVPLLAPLCHADIVHLRNGRKMEGIVQKEGGGYRLRMGSGSLFIPADQVARIEKGETALEAYAKAAALVKDDDAAGHYKLALFCRKKRLPREMAYELRAAIAIDPDHAEARRALGYERHEGKWLTREESMAAKGMVKFRGQWIAAEYKERLEAWAAEVKAIRAREAKINAAAAGMRAKDEKARQYARDAFVKLWAETGQENGEAVAAQILQQYEKIRIARRRMAARGQAPGMAASTTTGGLNDATMGTGAAGGNTGSGLGSTRNTGSIGFDLGGGQPKVSIENRPIPPVRIKLRVPEKPEP